MAKNGMTKHEKRRIKNQANGVKEDVKKEKKDSKQDYKIEKIKAVTAKAYAVASKRKWLVFLIVAAVAAYVIISKGGMSFGGSSGIVDMIKGFF
jgi:DNA primase catalytic subunit